MNFIMAVYGLSKVREELLIAYDAGIIDAEEFVILFDENMSEDLFPYWKVDRFNFEEWDDKECRTELRFRKPHLLSLVNALRFPEKFVCPQRTVCSATEGLCILLKRLAFPCRYTDMVSRFGRNPTELCLIFNTVLDYVYTTQHHRLQSWDQPFLQPQALAQYSECIHVQGAPLQNCFGFVDGTLRKIARPMKDQRLVYNGHKRVHGLKFQSVVIPNGLIANLSGPYEGRRHDSTILRESGLLLDLQRVAWHNNIPLCIYGDPAYPLSVHLQAPFRDAYLNDQMKTYNEAMSRVRVSVEWLFGDIVNYYKFIDFKQQQKIGLSAVAKVYTVCGILQNAHTCLYGNVTSDYFDLQPPTLQEYFW